MSASTMTVFMGLVFAITVRAMPQPQQGRTTMENKPIGFDRTAVQSERGKKFPKLIIPLAIILKLTTLVTATFTALKIFIVQSLVVSKVALLGAAALAFKAVYDHLRQQFMQAKVSEIYPYYSYPQVSVPDWSVDGWTPELTPYSHLFSGGDLHPSSSAHSRVAVPHIHSNDTPLMRSDEIRSRPQPPSKPPTLAYETIVAKITQSTHD